MVSTITATTTAAMIANFLEMVTTIVRKPMLRKLICVLNTHLLACVQSHMTMVSPLNLLLLYVPPEIYQQYTADPYPDPPINPGACDGNGEETAFGWTPSKDVWDKLYRDFADEHNMHRASVTMFMHHLDPNAVQSFQQEIQLNPNQLF